jgi:putative membrane protein
MKRVAWVIGGVSLAVVSTVVLLLLAPQETVPQIGALTRSDVAWLPHLNAALNGGSVILLSAGYFFIRRQQVNRHGLCMLAAFTLSTLFLLSYVVYHATAGSTHFSGPDWLRPIYFTILTSHVVLATLVLPLALTTLYRVRQRAFTRHRRVARWTLPIWVCVSASGVVVYLLLYHLK